MNCPECGILAEIVSLGTLELDLCNTCGGLWFDRNELERLFSLFEQGRMAELEQRAARATTEELEARVAKLEKQQSLPSTSVLESEPQFTDSMTTHTAVVLDHLFGLLRSLF